MLTKSQQDGLRNAKCKCVIIEKKKIFFGTKPLLISVKYISGVTKGQHCAKSVFLFCQGMAYSNSLDLAGSIEQSLACVRGNVSRQKNSKAIFHKTVLHNAV